MERVSDFMSAPFYCTKDTRIAEILYLLKKYNSDEILVVDNAKDEHPLGYITLEDIESQHIEDNPMPSYASAQDCMKKLSSVVEEHSSINECVTIMRDNFMQTIAVVDLNGRLKGIVSKKYLKEDLKEQFQKDLEANQFL